MKELAEKIMLEDERVQYDGKDDERIMKASSDITRDCVELIGKIGNYVDETESEIDEDSDRRMRIARQEVVEALAFSMLSLSKLARVFRIDSDEVTTRLTKFMTGTEEASLDMSGL
jgi:hypothetical protein